MKVTMEKKLVLDMSVIKPIIPPYPSVISKSITSGIKRIAITDTEISDKKLKISISQNINKKLEDSFESSDENSDSDSDSESNNDSESDSDDDSDEDSDDDSDDDSSSESDSDNDLDSGKDIKVDKLENQIPLKVELFKRIPSIAKIENPIPLKVELFKRIPHIAKIENPIIPILENPIPSKVELFKRIPPMEKWKNPSLEYPYIKNKKLKVVDKITTKYYTLIQYYFTGKPACCNDWNKNFSSDIVSQMEGINVSLNKIVNHWDLIPSYFIFNNNNNLPTAKLHKYKNSNINDTDVKVIIDDNITLVLRQVTSQNVNDLKKIYDDNKPTFKYHIISNLQFVTHIKSQINIYKNKNILEPNKAWSLHLILNEKHISMPDKNLITFMYKKKSTEQKNKYVLYTKATPDKLSILTLYQCLYLYFSKINT